MNRINARYISVLVIVLVRPDQYDDQYTNFKGTKRKAPNFLRNQELFGGDYWTRTSDLLRVKMRRGAKALLLGAFWYFLLLFFEQARGHCPLCPPADIRILVSVLVKAPGTHVFPP